jgi:hypothetical protein
MPLYVVSFPADPLAVGNPTPHRMMVESESKERAREVGEEWLSSSRMGTQLNAQISSLEVTEFSKFVMFEGEIYPRAGPSEAAERRLNCAKQAPGVAASWRKTA